MITQTIIVGRDDHPKAEVGRLDSGLVFIHMPTGPDALMTLAFESAVAASVWLSDASGALYKMLEEAEKAQR